MTEKIDLKKFIQKYPYSTLWGILGFLQIALSVIIMDGYVGMRDDTTLGTVFGFAGLVWGAVIVFMATIWYRFSKIQEEIEKIKRDNLLQDLQQEEQS